MIAVLDVKCGDDAPGRMRNPLDPRFNTNLAASDDRPADRDENHGESHAEHKHGNSYECRTQLASHAGVGIVGRNLPIGIFQAGGKVCGH
jgi:hypothetical protein